MVHSHAHQLKQEHAMKMHVPKIVKDHGPHVILHATKHLVSLLLQRVAVPVKLLTGIHKYALLVKATVLRMWIV